MGITHQGNHGNLFQTIVNRDQNHRVWVPNPAFICRIQTNQHNIVYISIRSDWLRRCILCHVLLCLQQFRIHFFLYRRFFLCFFLLLLFFLFFNQCLNFIIRHIVGFCIISMSHIIYNSGNDHNQHQKNPGNNRTFLLFGHLRLFFPRCLFLLFIVCWHARQPPFYWFTYYWYIVFDVPA